MDTDEHPPRAEMAAVLDEAMLAADPVDQFSAWLADATAAGLPEPNAMVLSTVSADGWPRSRSVLLKEHGPAGFVFYTNRTSGKAQDLAANPRRRPALPLVRAAPPGDRARPGHPAVPAGK